MWEVRILGALPGRAGRNSCSASSAWPRSRTSSTAGPFSSCQIQHQWGWTKAEIQVAFTIFVLCETWLVPFEGYVVDRIGPRWMILAGGVCTFLAWLINSYASSLWMLYLGGAVAGFAGGAVYGTSVGNALKWFPDKRGLCGGLTAAGFGAGAAITIAPIRA